MNDYLKTLNKEQLKAVKRVEGSTLVLAGAGTGKTTTIVSRVFYLIENGVKPENILLMTFTNKASNEMLNRVRGNLPDGVAPPFIGTFHKFGHLFITEHLKLIKDRDKSFRIVEYGETKNIIKKILEEESLNIEFKVEEVIKKISHFKNSNIHVDDTGKIDMDSKENRNLFKLYKRYEKTLISRNLIDLDDLQTLTYRILKDFPDIRNRYSNRYRYIMIDEFQDTNIVQYEIIKLLLSNHKNIFVVGDDDQSIYGWRGAEIENILNFDEHFPDSVNIVLNRNYRSTDEIILASNNLISKNTFRREKNIVSHRGKGEKIVHKHFADDIMEANFISSEIRHLIDVKNESPDDIAILYRMNALSFYIENSLRVEHIPYSIKGSKGTIYSKAEIKEIINYLNMLINPQNDNFFLPVLKQTQGVGEQSINIVLEHSIEKKLSIYETLKTINLKFFFKTRSKNFQLLVEKIDDFFENLDDEKVNLASIFEDVFGIRKKYLLKLKKDKISKDNSEKIQTKIDNIDSFYSLMEKFFKDKKGSIDAFVNFYSINEEDDDEVEEKVSLTSIHLSKGLEFKYLFLVGMNYGFLPNYNSAEDEEERRLAYVAFTRAKDKLYLTSSNYRTVYGKRQEVQLSPYLYEADILKRKFEPSRDIKVSKNESENRDFKINHIVKHKKFGYGKIVDISKEGRNTFLTILFVEIDSTKKIISKVVQRV